MKTSKKLIFTVIIIQVCTAFTYVDDYACKEVLFDYLDRMETIMKPEGSKTYHMEYTMNVEFKDAMNMPKSTTKAEVLVSKDRIMMKDQNFSLYGDRNHVFVVVPQTNTIFWDNSDPKIFEENNSYKTFLDIERKLLNTATSVLCKPSDGNKENIQVIPNEDFTKKTNLISQTITYSTTLKRIYSVNNYYNNKSNIKQQSITYDIVDFNSANKVPDPLDVLFKGKKLKDEFKGYEIVDNRKNK